MVLLNSHNLPVGWEAPDFQLKNTEEKIVSPQSFKDRRGLLVVFTCNHCPYAKAAWPLLVELHSKFAKDIGFVGINSNDDQTYPEDSFEGMKEKKAEWGIPFDYVYDPTQETGKVYQAQCTPDPYLFKNDNGAWRLFYHGRINDNWQDTNAVKEKNLEDAISALVAGDQPPSDQKPSMGCSIKWKK